MAGAAVCIRGNAKNGALINFSGFVIHKDGLILSTAHDLEGMRGIVVTFMDGTEADGNIIRLDIHKDLSMIKINKQNLSIVISPHKQSTKINRGEMVYMLHCRDSLNGKPYAGIVDRPMAMVNEQPLLQVSIEIQKGSSGNPIVDVQGNLVGVVMGRYRGTTARGFVIPTETVITFLSQDAL